MLSFLFERAPLVRLVGPRVYLRPPRRRDQRQWLELRRRSSSFLRPWEPTWPADATRRSAYRRRLKRLQHDWQSGTGYGFFIFDRVNDSLLGGITLSNLRRGVAQSGTIGYWIGQPYARRGYMTEALLLVLDFAFGELGLHRVEAACLVHNEASRGLLLKCGFTEEGLARRYLRIDGRWQDHRTFAILSDDPRPSLDFRHRPPAGGSGGSSP